MGKYLLKVEERPGGGGLPTRVGTHVTAQAGSVEVSAGRTGLDIGCQFMVSVSSFLQPHVSNSVSNGEDTFCLIPVSSGSGVSAVGGSVESYLVEPLTLGLNSQFPRTSVGVVASVVEGLPFSVDGVSPVNGKSDFVSSASVHDLSPVSSVDHPLVGLFVFEGATVRPFSPCNGTFVSSSS